MLWESIVNWIQNYLPAIPLLIVALNMIVIALLFIAGTGNRASSMISTVMYTLVLIVVSYIFYLSINGKVLILSFGVEYFGSELRIDALSAFMALLFALVALAVSIYSFDYIDNKAKPIYYILLSGVLMGLLGAVFAGDLFTLFVFYELTGASAYPLVGFYKTREAIEAAIKYLVMSATGSALVLLGIALVYGIAGSLNYVLIANAFSRIDQSHNIYLLIIFTLFIFGFGVKAAMFPLHFWLPDAYSSAPSSISAMLSGIVSKIGIYAMFRVLLLVNYKASIYTNVRNVLMLFALLTIVVPNLIAFVQKDIKRLLAYSSIYNMGLVLIAFSLGTLFGFIAALFHILTHTLTKALLFLTSGSFIEALETRNIDGLEGVGKAMKYSGKLFLVGNLSIAGIPPFVGFFSKIFVLLAIIQVCGGNIILIVVAVVVGVNTIVSLGYYWGVLTKKIWTTPRNVEKDVEEKPFMVAGEALLALAIIALTLLLPWLLDILNRVALLVFSSSI